MAIIDEDEDREGKSKGNTKRGVGRPPGVGRRDSAGRVATIIKALDLIKSGRVRSKAEAAALVGIPAADLAPSALQELFAIAPEFKGKPSLDLLSIVHDGNGKPETARQSLERGVVAAVAVLGRLAGRIGDLDKGEAASIRQAREWLALCRECGLWSDDRGQSLPGELRDSAQNDELDLAGVDAYLRAHNRRDGMGELAQKTLTERQALNSSASQPLGADDGD